MGPQPLIRPHLRAGTTDDEDWRGNETRNCRHAQSSPPAALRFPGQLSRLQNRSKRATAELPAYLPQSPGKRFRVRLVSLPPHHRHCDQNSWVGGAGPHDQQLGPAGKFLGFQTPREFKPLKQSFAQTAPITKLPRGTSAKHYKKNSYVSPPPPCRPNTVNSHLPPKLDGTSPQW